MPASVTLAQAALESGWGGGKLVKPAKNLFSIKGKGPAGTYYMRAWEVSHGRSVTVRAGFRKYHTYYESLEDHGMFLKKNRRYAGAFKYTKNPDKFARAIHKAGYATDPKYSTKLINIMKKYNLYQWDK